MGGVWAWLRGALGALVIVGATGTGLVVFGPQPLPVTLTGRATPASASALASPQVTPRLSTPTPAPRDQHAAVAVVPIGEISIPKIGLHRTIYEGVWETVIDVGPGHWP